jgi:glycosylphosphatidylinositol transamidase
MNNLLERLHASFFFYLLTGPGTFLRIGEYLPTAVIISTAMIFGGLRIWVDAGWVEQRPAVKTPDSPLVKWKTRHRNALLPLVIMLVTHVIGGLTFLLATSSWFMTLPTVSSESY